MAAHSNGTTVRRFFAAHAANDVATLLEILSADTVWHLPRGGTRLSDSPEVVGIDELAEMSARNFEASEGTFRFELERVFAGDSIAAALTHNTATAGGKSLDLHMVIQFRIDGGKIHEVWESPDDIEAFTQFWQAGRV
jgi:uncharacterized protein